MGRRKQSTIPDHLVDELLAAIDPQDRLAGKDGLLEALKMNRAGFTGGRFG
jgi:hypothetical protein